MDLDDDEGTFGEDEPISGNKEDSIEDHYPAVRYNEFLSVTDKLVDTVLLVLTSTDAVDIVLANTMEIGPDTQVDRRIEIPDHEGITYCDDEDSGV